MAYRFALHARYARVTEPSYYYQMEIRVTWLTLHIISTVPSSNPLDGIPRRPFDIDSTALSRTLNPPPLAHYFVTRHPLRSLPLAHYPDTRHPLLFIA